MKRTLNAILDLMENNKSIKAKNTKLLARNKKAHKKIKALKTKLEIANLDIEELKESIEDQNNELKQAFAENAKLADELNDAHLMYFKLVIEKIMRRIFMHVFTNCGYDSNFKFTDKKAIFSDIDISDIPHNIANYNCYDEEGNYITKVPVNGKISGVITQKGIPAYNITFNAGKFLVNYTITAQDPFKKHSGSDNLAKWAQDTQKGACILMLINENGLCAFMRSEPEQSLAEAKFTLMS